MATEDILYSPTAAMDHVGTSFEVLFNSSADKDLFPDNTPSKFTNRFQAVEDRTPVRAIALQALHISPRTGPPGPIVEASLEVMPSVVRRQFLFKYWSETATKDAFTWELGFKSEKQDITASLLGQSVATLDYTQFLEIILTRFFDPSAFTVTMAAGAPAWKINGEQNELFLSIDYLMGMDAIFEAYMGNAGPYFIECPGQQTQFVQTFRLETKDANGNIFHTGVNFQWMPIIPYHTPLVLPIAGQTITFTLAEQSNNPVSLFRDPPTTAKGPPMFTYKRHARFYTGGPPNKRPKAITAYAGTASHWLQIHSPSLQTDYFAGGFGAQILKLLYFDPNVEYEEREVSFSNFKYRLVSQNHLERITFELFDGDGNPHPKLQEDVVVSLTCRAIY